LEQLPAPISISPTADAFHEPVTRPVPPLSTPATVACRPVPQPLSLLADCTTGAAALCGPEIGRVLSPFAPTVAAATFGLDWIGNDSTDIQSIGSELEPSIPAWLGSSIPARLASSGSAQLGSSDSARCNAALQPQLCYINKPPPTPSSLPAPRAPSHRRVPSAPNPAPPPRIERFWKQ
jgi:hypothetical protein